MKKISPFESEIYFEIEEFKNDKALLALVRECIEEQKKSGHKLRESFFKVNSAALQEVSEGALNEMMSQGDNVSDIRTNRSISNCLAFNSKNMDGSVMDTKTLELRRRVDSELEKRLKRFFSEFGLAVSVSDSGHFWYPPGAFMGWHTNSRTPGWRLYINYAEEPGKSFFRYRNPVTGEIVTSWDKDWHFRLFEIRSDKPFWHSVYSDTNRYSLGYQIRVEPTFVHKIVKRIKRVLVS